ncbi:MAG TPA: hypothetical protein VH044_13395 [Polyangiaceae bacterium]|nr:hypothetical protein [Polyangiaceae bacterium]
MRKFTPEERASIFPGRVLHDSRHYRVELRAGTQTILLTRSAQPFVSREDVEAGCSPVQFVLDQLGRSKHNMLLDTREAIANNDPIFESWFAAHRRRMLVGFRRTALVTKTAVGGLQNRRLIQTDGTPVVIFASMDDALAYLEGEGSIPPPRRSSSPPPGSSSPPGSGRGVKE